MVSAWTGSLEPKPPPTYRRRPATFSGGDPERRGDRLMRRCRPAAAAHVDGRACRPATPPGWRAAPSAVATGTASCRSHRAVTGAAANAASKSPSARIGRAASAILLGGVRRACGRAKSKRPASRRRTSTRDQPRRGARLLERLGDDQRHRLAVMVDAALARAAAWAARGGRRPCVERRLRRRVLVGHHQQHARLPLGAALVSMRGDAALADRGADDEPIGGMRRRASSAA